MTTLRFSFRLNWLLVCFCLIQITGCAFTAHPEVSNLEIQDNAPLPNLTLVRRVVPEVGTAVRRHRDKNRYVQAESESRFGDSDEEPNLSCIYAGLKEALPSIDIIPTANFWEQVEAPQNVIELPELFTAPESGRLRALQADVLVIAYHARIDLEFDMVENVFAGGYSDLDRETAAVVVVDLNRKTIIHGSKITFEDMDFFFHTLFIIPMGFITLSPSDICETVAHQAGVAIAETMPDRTIRALVVVAGEEPMREDFEQQKREKLKAEHETEEKRKAEEKRKHLAILEQEANKGNTDAQLKLFKEIYSEDPNRGLRWLCKSADLGNEEARSIMAEIYEYGGFIWIKKGVVQQNYKLAYVWYALPGIYDEEDLQFFADRHLTAAELSDANKLLREWQPGQCEKDLGLVSYTE